MQDGQKGAQFLGVSVKGTPLENDLKELSYGFTRGADGCIVMQSDESMRRSWRWLQLQRHRILNEHNLPMDAVICWHMKTVIKNIKDEFEKLCFFLPGVDGKERWVIWRAPWQQQQAQERRMPAPPASHRGRLWTATSRS